ncbi:hypothetical protein C900_02294 [Fulvivirga imtechensis AK7]|uniref:GmrSD restriction endonucleases N-terminal domain-containing protein n=1 Tax=Fulvivirga imtechensis AK7 TaxID=1237149 RepID=L8JVS0_9BACT|nr:DUF262 domain-containing protein [Fulvivirga imtechensis]ELR71709.1 hypothetical protein C900_02294 [Fulvivirga imtechensis AK7]
MEFRKFSLQSLLEQSSNQQLVLPNFQRDYVWKHDQQQMLLASFLTNLPIGTFLILDGGKDDFVSKELCYNRRAKPTERCLFLLDGQQRLSTIKNIFYDLFGSEDWENNFDSLHYHLRKRWYMDLTEDAIRDAIGYSNLQFKMLRDNNELTPILNTKEPSDIVDGLKFFTIFKTTNKEKFYHPAFSLGEEASEYDNKIEVAMQFAAQKFIPLYDLMSEDKIVIKNCLKILANKRLESLKNIVNSDESNGYEISQTYLGHLDSTIKQKYKNNNIQSINLVWETLRDNWIESFISYFKDLFASDLMIPYVKSNELPRATAVFEYMNKGGTPLDTFDIMVAKYADVREEETLYDKLENSILSTLDIPGQLSNGKKDVKYSPSCFGLQKNDSIIKPIKEQFLNFLSIITKISKDGIDSVDVSHIKKDKILNLRKEEIENSLEQALKALTRSLAFLQFRCGIPNYNGLSYNLMLLPIGIALSHDEHWEDAYTLNKIEFWYWSSLFSGRFREKQNQRAINDLKELVRWISGGTETELPKRINNVFAESNYSDLNTFLYKTEDKTVPSAIHNGVLQYILSLEPNDFVEDERKLRAWEVAMNGEILNDHHIIPLGSVTTLGESTKVLRSSKNNILNSPLNRTLISQKANSAINSLSLERYLPLLNSAIEYSHCLGHSTFEKIPNNTRDEQETFLKNRFTQIKMQLQNELNSLKS